VFVSRESTLENFPRSRHSLGQASYGSGRACGPKGSILTSLNALHLFQMPQFLNWHRLAQLGARSSVSASRSTSAAGVFRSSSVEFERKTALTLATKASSYPAVQL
jgi:hypothetical protein